MAYSNIVTHKGKEVNVCWNFFLWMDHSLRCSWGLTHGLRDCS